MVANTNSSVVSSSDGSQGSSKGSQGPPLKYVAYTKVFKDVVRKMGLVKGCQYLREVGVVRNGKQEKLTKLTPLTLSKYIKRVDPISGDAVVLSRGNPKHKQYKVNDEVVFVTSSANKKAVKAAEATSEVGLTADSFEDLGSSIERMVIVRSAEASQKESA